MKKIIAWAMVCCAAGQILCGCAYRHYFGLNGPSVRLHPESHQGAIEDAQCLQCHHPARIPSGPPTNHPHFKGCLKCHNG